MEENELDALQSKEDKDYGFPFVEVKPLSAVENTKSEPSHVLLPEEKSQEVERDILLPAIDSNPIHIDRKPSKKRNNTPLLITLVMMLAVILAAMAYFLYYSPAEESISDQALLSETPSESQPILVEPEPAVSEDIEEVEEDEVILTQEEEKPAIPETVAPAVIQPATAPSGTPGKLQLVESKGEKSSYHLIVASLPNERIAKEEAQVFLNAGKDVWVLFPIGDTKNYRLSVGNFGSFKSASEALPQAKIEFGESTWILKF